MFSQSAYGVNESDGSVEPVIVLGKPLSTPFTVKVTTTDGSAIGS